MLYEEKDEFIKAGLGAVLFHYLKKYKKRVLQFVADTDEIDTYEQVLSRSIRTALTLKEKGATRDDIISTCTHNHKNTIIPYIASTFLGIKTAHFDPNLSHIDTVHLLKLIKPKIIFVALDSLFFIERCLEEAEVKTELVLFEEYEKYPNFSEYLKQKSDEEGFQPVVIADLKETTSILFSSGTTGLPKGICLNHYGLLGHNFTNTFMNGPAANVFLYYSTFYWLSAIMMLIKCITLGSARVVCAKFDATVTWKLVAKYKITSVFLAPYHARDLLAARQRGVDCSSLKYFLTGSTPVTTKLMKDLGEALPNANIVQGYAQTEAGGIITIFNPYDPTELELQKKKPLSCGKIINIFKWKIVDPETEEVVGRNRRGELRYKTDYQMNGYYKIDSSYAYDSEGYIKSGDIVYYDDDDCFYVVDRIKEMFKYKGWHIVPAVLEEVLANHPAVKEAVVIGIPHELDGEYPMAVVVLNKGYENTSPGDIEKFVEKMVSETQRLRAGVKFVNEIVRTTTGKVRRNIMKKMVLDGTI